LSQKPVIRSLFFQGGEPAWKAEVPGIADYSGSVNVNLQVAANKQVTSNYPSIGARTNLFSTGLLFLCWF